MPAAFRLFGAVMLVLPHAGLAFSSGAPASLCSSSTFAAGRARLCGVESLRARGQKSAEGRRALGIRRAPKCGASRASMAHLAEAAETTDSAAARGGAYEGIHHLEFWVGNAKQTATWFIARMGFEPVAYKGLETGSRDTVTHVVKQGEVRFAFTSSLNPNSVDIATHHARHGDGVRDVAIRVKDCRALYDELMSSGATSVEPPHEISDAHGSAVVASIQTYGDTVHSFIQIQDYTGPFLPGFAGVDDADPLAKVTESPKLAFVDHVVGNQPDGAMEEVCKWYQDVMGFKRFWSVDDTQVPLPVRMCSLIKMSHKMVTTQYSSLRSVVMTDEDETVKMPINEPANGMRKSQIQEFVDYYDGPGVQHIALRTFDIVHTVKMLRARGIKFLDVPKAYYDDLRDRLAASSVEVAEDLDEIERLNILVDFDHQGYLLQIFMRPIQDRPTVFLECIQRQSHQGFGVGNFKALFEAIEREQALRGNL